MLEGTPANVAVAQFREMQRQMPLLYALLAINAAAVAYTHYRFAPALLTIGVTGALAFLCIARVASWSRIGSDTVVTREFAVRRLRRTIFHAGALSVAFLSWSLALDQYGGPFERAHVAVFIAVTVIGCIFCLINLPQAALLVTAIVTIPYLVYYIGEGNAVFTAIAFNVALVTGVMIRVLLNSSRRFVELVQSQGALATKQRETEQLSRENARVAHTDSLTGLPNRRFFFSKLNEVLRAKAATRGRFAVGVLDLDRFKPLNDTYGHAFGDRLLAEVGKRLRHAADDQMIVARLGGDEFGLLLIEGADAAAEIGQRFCDIVARPFSIDDIEVSIGGSCGLAIYPEAGTTAHELFDRSDYALYQIKSEHSGGSGLFSIAHQTRIRSERAIETALQAADLEEELDVYFQPIIDLEAMTVVAVEALARWTSPKLGSVPPDDFIATAERIGLIHAITLTLFRKALAHAKRLPGDISLSFNLSAQDIASAPTMISLIEAIKAASISPGRITFELTETALLRDFNAAETAIQSLRSLGVEVALDDFGTGYSSLGYLRRLSLDKIKVDKSFAADLGSVSGRNMVTAISGLCDNLELTCIIEGIESDDQLMQIRLLGYRLAQGYLFARPMPMSAFLAWRARDSLRELMGAA